MRLRETERFKDTEDRERERVGERERETLREKVLGGGGKRQTQKEKREKAPRSYNTG